MEMYFYQNTQQTPIKMAKMETLITTKADKDMEWQEPSHIVGGDAKRYSLFGRHLGGFLHN